MKWPNDLLNTLGQKCGGILCTLLTEEIMLVGIGLNFGRTHFKDIPHDIIEPGSIDDKKILNEREQQQIPLDISQYLVRSRMSSEQIVSTWNQYCYHQNKQVIIIDENQKVSGFFRGVTPKGEAIIENNGRQKHIITGSLIIDQPL